MNLTHNTSSGPRLTLAVHRTLFTTKASLEHAKELVSAYKQGKIQSMTPELWQAKKTIDSTIHPGLPPKFALLTIIFANTLQRHRRASLSAFPHVLLCHLQFGRHSRNVDTQPYHCWYSWMANH